MYKAKWSKGHKLLLCTVDYFHSLEFTYLSYYSYIALGLPYHKQRQKPWSRAVASSSILQGQVKGWELCLHVFPPTPTAHTCGFLSVARRFDKHSYWDYSYPKSCVEIVLKASLNLRCLPLHFRNRIGKRWSMYKEHLF